MRYSCRQLWNQRARKLFTGTERKLVGEVLVCLCRKQNENNECAKLIQEWFRGTTQNLAFSCHLRIISKDFGLNTHLRQHLLRDLDDVFAFLGCLLYLPSQEQTTCCCCLQKTRRSRSVSFWYCGRLEPDRARCGTQLLATIAQKQHCTRIYSSE